MKLLKFKFIIFFIGYLMYWNLVFLFFLFIVIGENWEWESESVCFIDYWYLKLIIKIVLYVC